MFPGKTAPLPQTIGAYLVREKIGEGGMATVYRVTNPGDGQDYALKALNVTAEDTVRQRFVREAQTLNKLRHPHILPVYAFGEDHGTPYLVMRLLSGKTLDDLLDERSLDPIEVATMTRQIAGALDYAHAHGVIHRDIKPTNILLGDGGKVYLADFGIAYVAGESARLSSEGTFIGTVAYASPEQCRGDTLDRPSDIYSLAVMVFKMITGELPFRASSPVALMKKHLNEAPPNPIAFRPNLPIELYAVLARALAKLPENRFPSAMKFSDALDQSLGIHSLPQAAGDESWLYDDPPTGDDEPEFIFPPQSTGPPFPFEDEEDFGGFPIDEQISFPESFPEPVPSLPPPAPSVIREIGPRPLVTPRRRIPWERWAIYGSILISVMALIAAGMIVYNELGDSGLKLGATARSRTLDLTFGYPSGWSVASTNNPILTTDRPTTAILSSRPVPAEGPYDPAGVVYAIQYIDPIAVFGIPPMCAETITASPADTFRCMEQNRYVTPVYEPFDTDRYRGAKLPGTLPPTPASRPLILLAAGDNSWLAVIIVHWRGYSAAYEVLEAVAESVRPL